MDDRFENNIENENSQTAHTADNNQHAEVNEPIPTETDGIKPAESAAQPTPPVYNYYSSYNSQGGDPFQQPSGSYYSAPVPPANQGFPYGSPAQYNPYARSLPNGQYGVNQQGYPYGAPNVYTQPVEPKVPTDDTLNDNIEAVNFPPAEKVKSSGIRLFVMLICVVIALCAGLSGGYLLSNSDSKRVTQGDGNFSGISTVGGNTGGNVAEKGIAAAIDSVVGIVTYSANDLSTTSLSSGIIISDDGYILTNDHIYVDIKSPQFLIYLNDGSEYEAQFVAGDARSDLAVLKINATGLKKATFADSSGLAVGQSVAAIGCPGDLSLASSVTRGIISGVNRRISVNSNYSMKLIQTDAAINPGNSGGALINEDGQVVGVNSSKIVSTGYEGICFAIPSNVAVKVADDLINSGRVMNRAKLGISYQVIDALTAKENNKVTGLNIVSIEKSSNLYGHGFTGGDIITHINGERINGSGNFLDIIESCKPGDSVTLTIRKQNGGDRDITIQLIEDSGGSSYVK
ncbi:MAG: trypsin-like peptidase domain-containing protein [Firmicutes bacterium]|nr:trypsin-like peptidase domain-containing protein [Bacillota bacterium]